jgi:hypothetical protein
MIGSGGDLNTVILSSASYLIAIASAKFATERSRVWPESCPSGKMSNIVILTRGRRIGTTKINSALVNDLDVVSVRIEHPCRIIAWIVFEPGPG